MATNSSSAAGTTAPSTMGTTTTTTTAAGATRPAVSAIQLDQRMLDAIVAGVTAQLRANPPGGSVAGGASASASTTRDSGSGGSASGSGGQEGEREREREKKKASQLPPPARLAVKSQGRLAVQAKLRRGAEQRHPSKGRLS